MLYLGLFFTLALIVALSIWSGSRAKKGGKTNGTALVAGIILGTLVGGSSTIGTAQLAYSYGMSAWWWTLGGGIACLILGLVYAKPMRGAGNATLVGMIRDEYGNTAGMAASVLSAVGTFINIISQLIAASAVIAVVFPQIKLIWALASAGLFMALYVIFGGTKGAGIVGIVKIVLIYIAMLAAGIMVLRFCGGLGAFKSMVYAIDNPEGVKFFSLFARGFGKDAGACLSLILGVITTQTYAQGVLTAKSDKAAVGGTLISAFLIPPLGIGGILVGLYMRANASLYTGLTAKTALTRFVLEHMPSGLAGVVLGALFITIVGTGAGLALGISTIINNDIVKRLTHKLDDEKRQSALSKLWIVLVLLCAVCLSTGKLGDTILRFAFMSMGLRGSVVFVPLLGALWLRGRIDRKYATASIIISPLLVLLFGVTGWVSFDSLFVGILASLIIMAAGLAAGKKRAGLPPCN